MPVVSSLRLNVLRALYLMIFLFLASQVWPALLHHPKPFGLMQGVGFSTLGALSLLMLAGLRYPLKMLPVIFFEIAWKTVWLLAVGLPLILSHQMDPGNRETMKACLSGIIIFPIMIPWGYVVDTYIKSPGDRWK